MFTVDIKQQCNNKILLGWSGGAMALGKLPLSGRPTWEIVGQGPAALAVAAGGGCLDIFFISSVIFFRANLRHGAV